MGFYRTHLNTISKSASTDTIMSKLDFFSTFSQISDQIVYPLEYDDSFSNMEGFFTVTA